MPDRNAIPSRAAGPVQVEWGKKEWSAFIDAMAAKGAADERVRLGERAKGWAQLSYDMRLPSGEIVPAIPILWVFDFIREASGA